MLAIIFENIINSLESIMSNKLRSGLSMLWIIIWVSSVIILTALWNGSTKAITDQIEEMWTNILTLQTGRGFWSSKDRGWSSNILNDKLVKSIKENISDLKWVLPLITWNWQIIYSWNDLQAQVYWIDSNYLEARDLEIIYWTNIQEEHLNKLEKVAILGQGVVTELFEWKNPIWEKIKMWSNVFEVIWVLWENSTVDSTIFIPITTASIRVMWQKYYSQIVIVVSDANKVEQKQEEIDKHLQSFLKVDDPENLPYNIRNQSEMLSRFTDITWTLTMLLAWIAWISLLVWGIWVMNIMLVSITERTKEIGIRKAIWASRFDILLQFLTEALTLSVLWWTIWILLSYWVVGILNYFKITAIIERDSILLSFFFSLWIWLIFGILPAYKAAKLRPIEALRFE